MNYPQPQPQRFALSFTRPSHSPCTVFSPSSLPAPSAASMPDPQTSRPSMAVTLTDDNISCSCSPFRFAPFSSPNSFAFSRSPRSNRFQKWCPWRSCSTTLRRARSVSQKSNPHPPFHLNAPPSHSALPPHHTVVTPLSINVDLTPVPVHSSTPTPPKPSTELTPPRDNPASFDEIMPSCSTSSTASMPHSPVKSLPSSPSISLSSFPPSPAPALLAHSANSSNTRRPPDISTFADHPSSDGFSDFAFSNKSDHTALADMSQSQLLPFSPLELYGENINDDSHDLDDLFNDLDSNCHSQNSGQKSERVSIDQMPPSFDTEQTSTHDQFLHGDNLLPFEDAVVPDVSAFNVSPALVQEWREDGFDHNRRMNHGFSNLQNPTDICTIASLFLQHQANSPT